MAFLEEWREGGKHWAEWVESGVFGEKIKSVSIIRYVSFSGEGPDRFNRRWATIDDHFGMGTFTAAPRGREVFLDDMGIGG
jgi:hypothetical protein